MPKNATSRRHRAWPALACAFCIATPGHTVVHTGDLPPWGKASYLMPAQTPADMSRLNRLVIKFKANKTVGALGRSERRSADRVLALNAKGAWAVYGAGSVTLRNLKPVSDQADVVLTSRALRETEMQTLVRQLRADPTIEYVEVDERVRPHAFPINDTYYFSHQWSMKAPSPDYGAANFIGAWDRTAPGPTSITGLGVTVAVIDSGYRPHADLSNNLALPGYDFISADPAAPLYFTANDGDGRDADALDPGNYNTDASQCAVSNSTWHGTFVAGIIAAEGNNSTGIIGAAHRAKILPVRALGVCGGYLSDVAAGIRWAAGIAVPSVPNNTTPAKVINLSLGSNRACSSTYQDAIDEALAAGSSIVASTGNEAYTNSITSPARCKGVVAVTAHISTGDNASFANIGAGTTISAPGNGIRSLWNTGFVGPSLDDYKDNSGTSFAAPHVAAALALMLEAEASLALPTPLTPAQRTSVLVNSARAHAAGGYCLTHTAQACGAGLLDAGAAVNAVIAAARPFASASADKAGPLLGGITVTLTGVASAALNSGAITSVGWTQVAGPAVNLTGIATSVASFVTPATSASDLVALRFTANTATSSAVSVVTVGLEPAATSTGGGGGGGAFTLLDVSALMGLLLLGSCRLGRFSSRAG